MRKIHFADDLEERISKLLNFMNVEFTHESENKEQVLNFYLPQHDIYIEVKKFHTDKVNNQLKLKDNVILFQGIKTIKFLEDMVYEY
jgi:hypothetical protein